MKKTIISLLMVMVMLCATVCPQVLAQSVLSYGDTLGAEQYTSAIDYGRHLLETEEYVILHAGASDKSYLLNSRVHIYEKPNDEHMDYKFITTLLVDSTNASYDLAVREMWVYDDILYVSWNNVKTTKATASGIRGAGNAVSPLYAYDLSEIETNSAPTTVSKAGIYANAVHPYNRGGTSYLDSESGLLYHTVYSGSSYDAVSKTYYIYDVTEGATSTAYKTLKGGSIDAVKIYVKDGYLYEILHNNNGCSKSGTVTQEFNSVRIYDISTLESGANISSAFVGSYQTTIPGDTTINDVEAVGNTLYVATTKGVDVVDITDVKLADAENPVTLEKTEVLHLDDVARNLTLDGEKLYVALSTSMAIYDVAEGQSAPSQFEYTGGFRDFSFNEEENLLYALSGGEKGPVVMINPDMLFKGVNVSDVSFSIGSTAAEQIANGELAFEFTVDNQKAKSADFKTVYMLYEGSRLADISMKDWSVASGEEEVITDTLTVTDADVSHVKVLLAEVGDEIKLLPMTTEEGVMFEIEFGNAPTVDAVSEDNMEISEADLYGTVNVSGTIPGLKGKAMCFMAKNNDASSADRLATLRYLDVVTLDENGKYALSISPSDGGEYDINFVNIVGSGSSAATFTAPKAEIKVQDSIEIPGVEANIYVVLENGQNVDEINLDLSFDKDTVTASDDVVTSDEFEVKSVNKADGSINVVLNKKSAITKEVNEFCAVPITISSNAELGEYQVGASVTLKDKYGEELEAIVVSGKLMVEASTPKYDALIAAVNAIDAVKAPSEITVDNYLTELPKITSAREKVKTAYTYSVRDSQIGEARIEKLLLAEAKIAELKPVFDKVDELNNAEVEGISDIINNNKDLFGISEEALDIYNNMENKQAVDEAVSDAELKKPADVYEVFAQNLVLKAFKETGWQKVAALLTLAEDACGLDLDDYNELNENQKATANKEIAMREYDSITELQDALDDAVSEAEETYVKPSGSSSGGGRGGSSSNKIYVQAPKYTPEPTEAPKEPEDTKIFNDLGGFDWAEKAIEYLYENGVINGKAEKVFAPSDNVTREEFAKMAALAFDIQSEEKNITFTDVDEDAWYSEYVLSLASAGIINGRDDGSFGVGDYITREEIAVILDRITNYTKIELTEDKESSIADSDAISDYAKASVKKMCNAGIINGFEDGTVKPKEKASRAQTAQLLYNVLSLGK